jgi:DNA-binding NarL/FixJ family response regulator
MWEDDLDAERVLGSQTLPRMVQKTPALTLTCSRNLKRWRLLLADDHPIITEGLCCLLDHPDFEIAAIVRDGEALVQAAAKLKPDLIITDISIPLLNGIEAVWRIRKTDKTAQIIFLTVHADVGTATKAMAVGGSGYVLKGSASGELLAAVRQVLRGYRFIAPSIAQPVERALAIKSRKGLQTDGLTSRQREVLQQLAEGADTKQIATRLNLSTRTVEFHKYCIMEKLGRHDIAGLVRYAVKQKIVTDAVPPQGELEGAT